MKFEYGQKNQHIHYKIWLTYKAKTCHRHSLSCRNRTQARNMYIAGISLVLQMIKENEFCSSSNTLQTIDYPIVDGILIQSLKKHTDNFHFIELKPVDVQTDFLVERLMGSLIWITLEFFLHFELLDKCFADDGGL